MTPLNVRRAASKYATDNCAGNEHLRLLLVEAFINGYMLHIDECQSALAQSQSKTCVSSVNNEDVASSFKVAWELYQRKDNKQMAFRAWKKLTDTERQKALRHIPEYVKAHSEKCFRPMLSTYLNQKRFDDEEIITNTPERNEQQQRFNDYAEAISRIGEEG